MIALGESTYISVLEDPVEGQGSSGHEDITHSGVDAAAGQVSHCVYGAPTR